MRPEIDLSNQKRKVHKNTILIILALFILTIYFAKLLTCQNYQAKKSQTDPKKTSLMRYFDSICSINQFFPIYQAFNLVELQQTHLISRESEYSARQVIRIKGLMNTVKSSINLRLILMKHRFSTVKKSLEEIQTKKNDTLKLFHRQDHLRFMRGLVLGEKSPEAGYLADFTNAGLLHVLVASGFNVALVASLAWILVKSLPKGWQLAGTLAVIWLYVALLGFQPPLLRAAWMFSLVFSLQRWGIRTKRSRILVFSVAMILLLQPELFSSISLWLSALATLGILVFSRRLSLFWSGDQPDKRGIGVTLLEEAGTSFSAQSLIFPLLVWFFHSVNLVSFAANPLLLPWLGTMTQLASLEIILAFFDRWWFGRVAVWLLSQVMSTVFELYFIAVGWWQQFSFLNFTPNSSESQRILGLWAVSIIGLLLYTRSKHTAKANFFHETA